MTCVLKRLGATRKMLLNNVLKMTGQRMNTFYTKQYAHCSKYVIEFRKRNTSNEDLKTIICIICCILIINGLIT